MTVLANLINFPKTNYQKYQNLKYKTLYYELKLFKHKMIQKILIIKHYSGQTQFKYKTNFLK